MCSLLGIARSSYYKHQKRIKPSKEKHDELLCELILDYHSTFDGILGYRRMTMFINRLNHLNHSESYLHRLMKFLGITARIRRKKVSRTKSKPEHIKENLLNREFQALAPNEKWLTDVTEFSVPGDNRKLYLSPILDLYDNSIVSYKLSFSNSAQLVFDTFDEAMESCPDARPIVHSDRGYQYTSNVFKKKLEEAQMAQSMSRKGKCIDNGPMEGFFGSLKTEMFYSKKFRSLDEVKAKIIEYIEFYNNRRFQKKLGNLAPIELRNQYLSCA